MAFFMDQLGLDENTVEPDDDVQTCLWTTRVLWEKQLALLVTDCGPLYTTHPNSTCWTVFDGNHSICQFFFFTDCRLSDLTL